MIEIATAVRFRASGGDRTDPPNSAARPHPSNLTGLIRGGAVDLLPWRMLPLARGLVHASPRCVNYHMKDEIRWYVNQLIFRSLWISHRLPSDGTCVPVLYCACMRVLACATKVAARWANGAGPMLLVPTIATADITAPSDVFGARHGHSSEVRASCEKLNQRMRARLATATRAAHRSQAEARRSSPLRDGSSAASSALLAGGFMRSRRSGKFAPCRSSAARP